ncbi:hypothetical protein AB0G74_20905 [Streptomyces sp. NPDC020875]|uniref:hypothetical protein n=1 Tax=Streptomyces sp. NPDC020875 TaxID=3154898 RepID=UPI0033F07329
MANRQRNRRLNRLRRSPGYPSGRRRRTAVAPEGTAPAVPRSDAPDAPDAPSTDSA